MEIILFGGIIWAVIAMIRAHIRKEDEKQEAAAQQKRAVELERAQALEVRRWRHSLMGTVNGTSRFGLVLAENVRRQNWPAISEMITTLPNWPIRGAFHRAIENAQNLRYSIELSRASGVPSQACDMILDATTDQEYALWGILDRTSLVGQSAAANLAWRRLDRNVRKLVDADMREVGRISDRMTTATRALSVAIAQGDRRDRRHEQHAAEYLATAAEALRSLTQN